MSSKKVSLMYGAVATLATMLISTLRFRKFYKWPRQSDINQLSYQFPLDYVFRTETEMAKGEDGEKKKKKNTLEVKTRCLMMIHSHAKPFSHAFMS